MKAGYSEAAWRLFQPKLLVSPERTSVPTWADTELAGTPFGRKSILLIVPVKGSH